MHLSASTTLLLCVICYQAFAQPGKIQETLEFNPSVSSIMLQPGQWEFNLYSSYLFNAKTKTYNKAFKRNSKDFIINQVKSMNSYFVNTLQASVGVGRKLTVGMDFGMNQEYLNYSVGDQRTKEPNNIINIAPRVRWEVYHNRKSNLVLQHYFQIPLKKDTIPNIFNTYLFGNQVIWTMRVDRFILMNQLDILIYNKPPVEKNQSFMLPYTFYASYLVNTETMVFGLAQYVADFGSYVYAPSDCKYYTTAYSVNIGLGIQRRIARNMSINVFYNHALAYSNYLGYHSVNVGFRYATR